MKKILSILSASVLALTMSISAFADDKPSKDEIEKAFMEYMLPHSDLKLEYELNDSFATAWSYNDLKLFLDSEDFKKSKFVDIDLSDEKELKKLDEYIGKWLSENNSNLYPKIKWDISQISDSYEQKETGEWKYKSTQDYKTTYTAKKSGNKWVMKEDQSGEVVMTIPVIPSKFDYIYENAEKENSKDDDSSRPLITAINAGEDPSGNGGGNSAGGNSAGGNSGNNNNSTNGQSDSDNNSSSKNSSAGTNNNTQSGGTSDNGGSSPANGGKSEENSNGNSSNSSASESEENEEQEDSNTTVWVIVLVAVVAAGIIVFFVFKKKK